MIKFGETFRSYSGHTQKQIPHFLRSHFQCIFNDFGFLVDIAKQMTVMNFYVGGPGQMKKGLNFVKDPVHTLNKTMSEFSTGRV